MISYREIVNENIVEKLSKITLSQFTYLFNLSTTKRHNEYNLLSEYTKIKNYCLSYLKNKNNYIVNYGHSKNKENIGRLQSKNPSLQRLYNGIRGALQNDITYDIDMKNCHPCIILNLCKQHNIKYNNLYDYINNREQFIKEISNDMDISRSEVKTLILKSLNKTELTLKYNNKKIKNKSFLELDKELTNITESLYKIIENDEKYKNYDNKQEYNYKGKLVNLYLTDIENDYLMKAVKYIESKNIKISTLMYDGLMIYKDNYDINNIINELNNIFKEYSIQWDIKQHNTELKEPILNLKIDENINTIIKDDIIEIGDYLIENILKDKLIRSEGTFYFIGEEKIIENNINNTKEIEAELYKIIIRQELYLTTKKYNDKEESHKNISKEPSKITILIKHCLNCCIIDNNFLENIWRETQFKIFFKNGYYDFKKSKFIQGSYNRTFIKINRDFNIKTNNEIRKEIFNKVLNPVFSIDNIEQDKEQYELQQYFLYRLARIIAGNIEDKRWVLLQGLRNSGKGVISDILKNCFQKYIKTTNSGNFEFKKNINDEGKALSWLIDFQFSRLAITQEINLSDNNKINGNSIKKFCSGGDYFQARKNFKDEIEFKIQSSLMVCCNDLPETNPSDALEFMDEFQMKSKFIDDDYDEMKLETFKYYKKDDYIKSVFLYRDDVINEFIHLIFESYNKKVEYPETIKNNNKENDEDNDYEKLFNTFKITNDNKDFISNNEFKQICKNNNIPFSIKKIKMLLKTKGAQEGRNKTSRGLICISLNDDNNED